MYSSQLNNSGIVFQHFEKYLLLEVISRQVQWVKHRGIKSEWKSVYCMQSIFYIHVKSKPFNCKERTKAVFPEGSCCGFGTFACVVGLSFIPTIPHPLNVLGRLILITVCILILFFFLIFLRFLQIFTHTDFCILVSA